MKQSSITLGWQSAATLSLLLYVAVCLASYAKSEVATRTFMELGDYRLLALFLGLYVGLAGIYLGLATSSAFPSRRLAWLASVAFAVPLLATFPVSSRDVFLYAFYGKMWSGHLLNPYLNAPVVLQQDPWLAFLPRPWGITETAPYGPLFLELVWCVHKLAGDNLFLSVVFYKAINLVSLGLSAYFLLRIVDLTSGGKPELRTRALALWLWSPLVLLESLGSAHNDLPMAALMLAALLCWLRRQSFAAWALLAISIWFKWYSALLAPIWLLWDLRRGSIGATLRQTTQAGLAVALVSLPILAPFASSIPEMLQRLGGAGSVLIPAEMPPPLWGLFHLFIDSGWFGPQFGERLFHFARLGSFVIGTMWLLWTHRSTAYTPAAAVQTMFWCYLMFFSFVPMTLSPWYLVSLCALGLAAADRDLDHVVAALTGLALLSYFLTFSLSVILCLVLAGVLWVLRHAPNGRVDPQTGCGGE